LNKNTTCSAESVGKTSTKRQYSLITSRTRTMFCILRKKLLILKMFWSISGSHLL